MLEKITKISNPLTVIAIFAAITEVMATAVLPFVTEANQTIFLWFLIIFPVMLVLLFFLTINFNHKVLYSPSDYQEDSSFLAALNIKNNQIKNSEKMETYIHIGNPVVMGDRFERNDQERKK